MSLKSALPIRRKAPLDGFDERRQRGLSVSLNGGMRSKLAEPVSATLVPVAGPDPGKRTILVGQQDVGDLLRLTGRHLSAPDGPSRGPARGLVTRLVTH